MPENFEGFMLSGFQIATLSKRDSESVSSLWILRNTSQQTAYIQSVKNAHIQRFSDTHFSAFGLDAETSKVNLQVDKSVQIRENADQKNSKYGHFSRSDRPPAITDKSLKS